MILGDIFGGWDIVVVLVVVLVVFGGSRLPKLARSLGSATSEFKKGIEEGDAPSSTQAPSDAHQEHPSSES
jgi:sec-independent protein translocase protein TatA